MKTKSVIFSSVISLLIVVTICNDGFGQTICATCPENTVSGHKASAFGEFNIASGSYSFVAGRQSEANKPNTGVIGSWSKATGDNSYVIGNFSHASGVDSYVFGNNSTSEMDFSMALGHNILSRNGAFVLGNGRVDAKLTNNLQESLMIGFNSAFPTLFVSRTQLDYQSGKIGIGNITAPEAKLHIRADAVEDATMMLEATGEKKRTILSLHGGQAYIGTTSERHSLNFFTGEGINRMTIDGESGNVGIGITSPTSRLHVAGNAHISDNLIINNTTTITDGRIGRFANGSASAPAYSFSGNTNTGMFQPATNTLAFSTGGTEKVRIASNGNVGIGTGTTTPGSKLQVNGNVAIGYSSSTSAPVNGLAVAGNVGIGTTSIMQINVNASMFAGVTPKLHIRPNNNPGEYQEMVLLQQSYNNTPVLRRLGYIMKLGDAAENEVDKMGGLVLDSESDWGNNPKLHLVTANQKRLTIVSNGSIGIGTTSPQKMFHVVGQSQFNGDMWVASANVYVNGEIHAKKFRATYSPWPDYVFDPDYELPGLCEIEHFVTTNRHLPGLPPAAQVEEEGFELAEMNGLLLKKIEELTLYLIDQQKEINALKEKMSRIETQ